MPPFMVQNLVFIKYPIQHILPGKVSQKALEADTNSEKSCETEYHWMPLSRDFLAVGGNKSVQYKSMIT